MTSTTITLQDPAGRPCPTEVTYAEQAPWWMRAVGEGFDERAQAEDLFAALGELRLRLEPRGYRLLVAGARDDAWPSVEDRIHDHGRRVWLKTSLGEAHSPSDRALRGRVHLLDPAPAERVTTLAQQHLEHARWLTAGQTPSKAHHRHAEQHPTAQPIHVRRGPTDPRRVFEPRSAGWWRLDVHGSIRDQFEPNPRAVEILEADGTRRPGQLLLRFETEVQAHLWGAQLTTPMASGADAFVALARLRVQLDARGARLLCNAARVDTWRKGSDGRTVLRTRLGKTSAMPDWLDALGAADASDVGTVLDQRQFHARWLGSLVGTDEHSSAQARSVGDGFVHLATPGYDLARTHEIGIRGSWPVVGGEIVGDFVPNPYYRMTFAHGRNATMTPEQYEQRCHDAREAYAVPTGPYPLDGR